MSDNRSLELAAVTGVFLGLAVVFTSLRVYVRAFLTRSWGADDTLLLGSLVFFILFCAGSFSGIALGTGQHIDAIKVENVPKALRLWWLGEIYYTMTTWLVRLSVGVFLIRISIKPLHRWIIYTTMAVVSVFSVFFFFLVIFQCTPVGYFWAQFEGMRGNCVGPNILPKAAITHSVVAFCADWVLGLLPIAILHTLEMNARTKLSVAGLLSLGLLAGIATMIRVPGIHALRISDDWLYKTVDVAIWSTVEPGLGIIAVAGATLRPIFRRFLSTHRGTTTDTFQSGHTSQVRRSDMDLNKNISYMTHTTPYSPFRSHNRTPSSPIPNNKIVSSPTSARFDFAYGEKTGTMNSTTSRSPFVDSREATMTSTTHMVPLAHMREVNSPTRVMSPAFDDDAEIDARDSIRGLTPTPPFLPSNGGIQVQRTVEIHEMDELDKSPEGFIYPQ